MNNNEIDTNQSAAKLFMPRTPTFAVEACLYIAIANMMMRAADINEISSYLLKSNQSVFLMRLLVMGSEKQLAVIATRL